jgi:hypothetical protein
MRPTRQAVHECVLLSTTIEKTIPQARSLSVPHAATVLLIKQHAMSEE